MQGGVCNECPPGFKCSGTSEVEAEKDDDGQVSHWIPAPDVPGTLLASVTLHGLEYATYGTGSIGESVKAWHRNVRHRRQSKHRGDGRELRQGGP